MGKNALDRSSRAYEGPQAGVCLAHLRIGKEAKVAGMERAGEKGLRDEVCAVMRGSDHTGLCRPR